MDCTECSDTIDNYQDMIEHHVYYHPQEEFSPDDYLSRR